jgi:lipopolysaccharide export system protein LptA
MGALRLRLLTGAALVIGAPLSSLAFASAAQAQTAPVPVQAPAQTAPQTTTEAAPGADGLTPDAVFVDADSAQRQGDVISAQGSAEDRVMARFQDHSLRAKDVTYDLQSQIATASGDAELTAPDGSVVHAERIELDSDFKTGVAVDLATRLSNGSSLFLRLVEDGGDDVAQRSLTGTDEVGDGGAIAEDHDALVQAGAEGIEGKHGRAFLDAVGIKRLGDHGATAPHGGMTHGGNHHSVDACV